MNQVIAVGAGWGLAIVGTLAILALVRLVTPLRVTEEQELGGLDLALHGESAYNTSSAGTLTGLGDEARSHGGAPQAARATA